MHLSFFVLRRGKCIYVGTGFTPVRSRKRECANSRDVTLSEERKLKREERRESGLRRNKSIIVGTAFMLSVAQARLHQP